MMRVLAGVLMFAGIFTLPWALFFAGAIFFAALFPWFIEAIFIGSLVALIADVAWWKIFLIFGSVLTVQEWLKTSINFEKRFAAMLWLCLAGSLAFIAVFFILI
ncbi:MAG: hypothetical protein AAB527_02470 [Patescibacteria group bacterium]